MVTNLYKESVRGEESFEAFVDSVGDMTIHRNTA
jgi:putative DeoR family transcriptional regulator, stage III sporulation protein D